eukprot:COSAG02_NODE_740_length_17807_cov_30.958987_1_plen_69_part_00
MLLPGRRLSCCRYSVCMGRTAAVIRTSKLRCESFWTAFELLQMQQVYGCTVVMSSHQQVALCVSLGDV